MPVKYDHTFENRLRHMGISVTCMWQLPAIKHTLVAGMECLNVNGRPVIVQTFEGGGWEVFTPSLTNGIDKTVADALARCGVLPQVAPASARSINREGISNMKLTIEIEGKRRGDLMEALEEILRLVEAGNIAGLNSNDDGSFHFDIKGDGEDDDD